jgi:hypothetical protein
MDYSELTAKELRELCEKRGIKPSRAKADMIEDLKARDAADELTRLSEELGLRDEPLTVSEDVQVPEVHPEPVGPVEEPPAAFDETVWFANGRLYKTYPHTGPLQDAEHASNLSDVIEEAVIRGKSTYGPSFRVRSKTGPWVYAIHVR